MPTYIPGQFAREYATDDGQALWALLTSEANVARMETASDLDQPALKPLEDTLLETFGERILADRMKQMTGHMVRQIMESRGYVHDVSDVRLSSVPFYKASRYRRADRASLYLFRNSKDPREIVLAGTRDATLPQALDGGRWLFVNTISSPIKAAIGYNFDLKVALKVVADKGFFLARIARIMRAA